MNTDRFKFRAFDKDNKKYIENNYKTVLSMNGQLMDEEVTPFMARTSFVNYNHIIEQCTGLKDKNGVLIYEGDLFKDEEFISRVIFEDGCFILETTDISCDWCDGVDKQTLDLIRPEILEVIGNIHQNKELLND